MDFIYVLWWHSVGCPYLVKFSFQVSTKNPTDQTLFNPDCLHPVNAEGRRSDAKPQTLRTEKIVKAQSQ